jgi:hypothetical protein
MKYLGYQKDNVLPFKKGDTVIIPKGVLVYSMHPQKDPTLTKRSFKVKIDHFMSGQSSFITYMNERDCYRNDGTMRINPKDLQKMKDEYWENKRQNKDTEEPQIHFSNPKVCWAGAGRYWHEVDINDILEANGK